MLSRTATSQLFTLALCSFLTACIPDDPDGQGEALPLPTLTVGDVTLAEGSDGVYEATVPVTLEGTNLTNAVVDYRTVAGTATAGEDFAAVTDGKLLFNPGVNERDVTLTLTGDKQLEGDESFAIEFSNPRNLLLADETATVTLVNDDRGESKYNLPAPDSGYATPAAYEGRELLWADEFDGDELDRSRWTFEIGNGSNGWGNQELQYYREENTVVDEGALVIQARAEEFGGSDYTSSRIITMDKEEFAFGRIDIRAALPEGQGLWPALWMLGANFPEVGWPSCGEIDIMEALGQDTRRILGTAHFGTTGNPSTFKSGRYDLGLGNDYVDRWHVYSIEWERNRIRWFVDDVQYHELTQPDLEGKRWPFNEPFFMIFNVAVGGQLPGSPDETTIFPQRMAVDYVRVFR